LYRSKTGNARGAHSAGLVKQPSDPPAKEYATMTTIREEFRALLPPLTVTLLFPVPLLNFVQDGTGRAFAFAYLFFGCALLAADCYRPSAGRDRWKAKMGALAAAMTLAVLNFSVCYLIISGSLDWNAVTLAFLVVVPALCMVPCLTLLVGHPYAAVVFAALLLGAVKLAGCLVARLVYGPTAQADGQMSMSWDQPNLLVWFCFAGGLLVSAALGVLGFRLASSASSMSGS
jgi:hypothetical protein